MDNANVIKHFIDADDLSARSTKMYIEVAEERDHPQVVRLYWAKTCLAWYFMPIGYKPGPNSHKLVLHINNDYVQSHYTTSANIMLMRLARASHRFEFILYN